MIDEKQLSRGVAERTDHTKKGGRPGECVCAGQEGSGQVAFSMSWIMTNILVCYKVVVW